MSVIAVKIHDRQQRIQRPPQTSAGHRYPVITSGCITEVQGPELIKKWVQVIKKQSGVE